MVLKEYNHIISLYQSEGGGAMKELLYPSDIPKFEKLAENKSRFMRVLNFTDVRYSMRFNPIQLKYIPTIQDAVEYSDRLLQYYWKNTEGAPQYFHLYKETSVNILAACIWFFMNYKALPYKENREMLFPEYYTDKETNQRLLTGRAFETKTQRDAAEAARKTGVMLYDGLKEPAYWLGKYSDLPHVLSFLCSNYKQLFEVLSTNAELYPYIDPYLKIYCDRDFELLDLTLLPLRVVTSKFQTKEAYWILHRDGDDFDLSDIWCRDYLMIMCKESQKKFLDLYSLLITGSAPSGEPQTFWSDTSSTQESYDTLYKGLNIRPYHFDSKDAMNRCLLFNYRNVQRDVDTMKYEILKTFEKQ